jgi:hypothetical protein
MAWVAAVCVAVLAAGCGSITAPGAGSTATATASATPPGTSSADTPGAAATPGPCATAALRLTLGHEGAAAGHFYRTLDFTNISSASCTLYGYPGISFVTAPGGQQIGAAASRSPASKRLIVLAPGKKAHARLDLLDVLNFPPPECAASNAHWLKVYPPSQFSARYVPWTATVCSKPRPVYLFIGSVRPGA